MKKYFMMLVAIFAFSAAYASCGDDDRLYVEPGCIYVAPNGIFLNIEGEFYGVSAIEADENGVYVPTPALGFCGKHGYYPGSSTICPKCQAERKKK